MKLSNLVRFAGIALLSLTIVAGCASGENTESSEPANVTSNESAKLKFNQTNNGVAIRGADPVAYFKEGKAVAGSEQYTYEWGNATWRFSSEENRDLFAENPEKYAPQYGGFCAWAVSQNELQGIDPDAWSIVDGKLYLNYNESVQNTWKRNIQYNINNADRNWPRLARRI